MLMLGRHGCGRKTVVLANLKPSYCTKQRYRRRPFPGDLTEQEGDPQPARQFQEYRQTIKNKQVIIFRCSTRLSLFVTWATPRLTFFGIRPPCTLFVAFLPASA